MIWYLYFSNRNWWCGRHVSAWHLWPREIDMYSREAGLLINSHFHFCLKYWSIFLLTFADMKHNMPLNAILIISCYSWDTLGFDCNSCIIRCSYSSSVKIVIPRIFKLEQVRRLRIQQRLKSAELGILTDEQENELPNFPSFIPFLPPLVSSLGCCGMFM